MLSTDSILRLSSQRSLSFLFDSCFSYSQSQCIFHCTTTFESSRRFAEKSLMTGPARCHRWNAWKLPVNVASKNLIQLVCWTSACLEVFAESCFFYNPTAQSVSGNCSVFSHALVVGVVTPTQAPVWCCRQFPQSCVQSSCCVTVVHTLDHLHHH